MPSAAVPRQRGSVPQAFSEDDVRHAYCFCIRVPRKQTLMLSELHFALVSPAVVRMLPADFGAISRIDKEWPNCKAHARAHTLVKQVLSHMMHACAGISVGVPQPHCRSEHVSTRVLVDAEEVVAKASAIWLRSACRSLSC